MNETEKRFLENRFLNLDARCTAIEHELIDYMEQNPKGTDQWIEARLRALELQIASLATIQRHVNILRREVMCLDPGVNLDE